jgi:hypothetical protein
VNCFQKQKYHRPGVEGLLIERRWRSSGPSWTGWWCACRSSCSWVACAMKPHCEGAYRMRGLWESSPWLAVGGLGRSKADDELQWRLQLTLDDKRIGAGRNECRSNFGHGGVLSRSWVPLIGRETVRGGRSRSNR